MASEIPTIKMEDTVFDDGLGLDPATMLHSIPTTAAGGMDINETEIFKYFLNDDELTVPSGNEPMDLSSVANVPFAAPSMAPCVDSCLVPCSSPSSDSSLDSDDHDQDDQLDDVDEALPSSSSTSPHSSLPNSPQQPQAICPKALHAPASPSHTTSASSDSQTMPHNPRKRARTESPEPRPTSDDSDPLSDLTTDQLKKLSSKTLEAYAQNLAACGALSTEAEKQIKRHRRLIKNRESAQLSRLRKKMYIDELERKVNHINTQNDALVKRVAFLTQENKALRDEVAYLQGVIKQNPSLGAAAAAGRKPLSNNVKAAGVCMLIVLFSFGLIFNARKIGDPLGGPSAGAAADSATSSLLSALGLSADREVMPGVPAVRRGSGRVLTSLEDSGKDEDGENNTNGRKRKREEAFGEADDAETDYRVAAEAERKKVTVKSESLLGDSDENDEEEGAVAVEMPVVVATAAVSTPHNTHKRAKVVLTSTPVVQSVSLDDVDMTDVDNDTVSDADGALHAPHRAAVSGSTFIVCPLSSATSLSAKKDKGDVILDGAEDQEGEGQEFLLPLTDAAAELSTRLLSTRGSAAARNGDGVVALLVPSDMLSSGLAPLGIDTRSVVEVSCQVLNVNVFPTLAAVNAL